MTDHPSHEQHWRYPSLDGRSEQLCLFEDCEGEVAEAGTASIDPIAQQVARVRLRLVAEPGVEASDRVRFDHPSVAARFFAQILEGRPQEVMLAAYLDSRHSLICWQQVFVGTMTRTAVAPAPILQSALLANAAGIVLAHNHPSGDPTPSPEDLIFTRRFVKAAEVVGLRLIDHLTIGARNCWVSLRQGEGW